MRWRVVTGELAGAEVGRAADRRSLEEDRIGMALPVAGSGVWLRLSPGLSPAALPVSVQVVTKRKRRLARPATPERSHSRASRHRGAAPWESREQPALHTEKTRVSPSERRFASARGRVSTRPAHHAIATGAMDVNKKRADPDGSALF